MNIINYIYKNLQIKKHLYNICCYTLLLLLLAVIYNIYNYHNDSLGHAQFVNNATAELYKNKRMEQTGTVSEDNNYSIADYTNFYVTSNNEYISNRLMPIILQHLRLSSMYPNKIYEYDGYTNKITFNDGNNITLSVFSKIFNNHGITTCMTTSKIYIYDSHGQILYTKTSAFTDYRRDLPTYKAQYDSFVVTDKDIYNIAEYLIQNFIYQYPLRMKIANISNNEIYVLDKYHKTSGLYRTNEYDKNVYFNYKFIADSGLNNNPNIKLKLKRIQNGYYVFNSNNSNDNYIITVCK